MDVLVFICSWSCKHSQTSTIPRLDVGKRKIQSTFAANYMDLFSWCRARNLPSVPCAWTHWGPWGGSFKKGGGCFGDRSGSQHISGWRFETSFLVSCDSMRKELLFFFKPPMQLHSYRIWFVQYLFVCVTVWLLQPPVFFPHAKLRSFQLQSESKLFGSMFFRDGDVFRTFELTSWE